MNEIIAANIFLAPKKKTVFMGLIGILQLIVLFKNMKDGLIFAINVAFVPVALILNVVKEQFRRSTGNRYFHYSFLLLCHNLF